MKCFTLKKVSACVEESVRREGEQGRSLEEGREGPRTLRSCPFGGVGGDLNGRFLEPTQRRNATS